MPISNAAQSALLALLFENEAFAEIGDSAGLPGSATAGSLYVALHTAGPGASGSQSTNEAQYPGYARVAVPRASGSWTISGSSPTTIANAADLQFQQATGGSETETYWSIGLEASGATAILVYAPLSSSAPVSDGIVPQFGIGALTTKVEGNTGATEVFSYADFSGEPDTVALVNDAASFLEGTIAVTNGVPGAHEAGAAWYTTPVNIVAFTTDFTFKITGGVASIVTTAETASGGNVLTFASTAGIVVGQEAVATNIPDEALVESFTSTTVTLNMDVAAAIASGTSIQFVGGYGMCFIIQNDPRGTAVAVDANGIGYLQESNNPASTAPASSVAIAFNASPNSLDAAYYIGANPSATGLYVDGGPFIDNGIYPLQDLTPQGINLQSGDVMSAHVVYDGTTLSMALTDTVTGAQAYFEWLIDIPEIVGADTAYVGFGAGTIPGVVQSVNSWDWYQGYNARLASPTLSPAPGSYTSSQSVSISGPSGSTIYYTTNGKPPTTASSVYSGAITVSENELIQAIAVQAGYTSSFPTQGNYQIQAADDPIVNFASGFTSANGLVQTAAMAAISGADLVLTNGGSNGEIGAAWYAAPVNIQAFTCIFTLVLSPASNGHDSLLFVLQNQGETNVTGTYSGSGAISGGPFAFGLGEQAQDTPYGGYFGIGNSVAVKFDNWNGTVGMFTGGGNPYTPQTDITGITLTSGDPIKCTLTYDGTTLTLSMEDTVTEGTFETSWTVDIPEEVGAETAYVGFTAGVYDSTTEHSVTAWTYAVT